MNNILLFRAICGSKLYGTDTPTSDTDIFEVYFESQSQLFGLGYADSLPQKITDEQDTNRHWFRKFCGLAAKANPNVLEPLFAPDSKILEIHPLFDEYIRVNRRLFLSVEYVRKAFFGFANAQIKKMEIYAPDRGADRKALIDKYGYDLKYAAHSLRLLWEMSEILHTHDLFLPLEKTVRDTLIHIKTGGMSKSEFLNLYMRENKRIEDQVNANKTNLRKEPDRDKIDDLMINMSMRLIIP